MVSPPTSLDHVTDRHPDDARITLLTAVPELVTQYAPMRAVLALVERAAASDAPVAICGEHGTGKSLIARFIHRWSARAAAPLADVRCAGVPAGVVERELFGETSNASGPLGGLFVRARGGTLYLREIGALDMRLQGMLFRALTCGGGDEGRGDPVRVIASNLDDLARRVGAGAFRAELFTRLSAVRITLPPLRERVVDVRPLAEHFLRMPAGRRSLVLSDEAVEALENYRWPGNVRELRSVVQRAALLASDGIVRAAHLRLEQGEESAAPPAGDGLISLDEMERRHIQLVLERVAWHQGRAAGILGISPKTLYRKMRGYGLTRPARPVRRIEREHMA